MAELGALTGQASLGAGIGLSGTPRNYVPDAMRAEQFQQKMEADAAAKQLTAMIKNQEKEAEEREKFEKEAINFKATGGLPYTTTRRLEFGSELVNKYKELKEKNPGRNPTNSLEYQALKLKLEDEALRISNEEKFYTGQFAKMSALKEDDRYDVEQNVPLINAINDPTGKAMRSYNLQVHGVDSPYIQSGDSLYTQLPINIEDQMASLGRSLKADIDTKTRNLDPKSNEYVVITDRIYNEGVDSALNVLRSKKSWGNKINEMIGRGEVSTIEEGDRELERRWREVYVPANIKRVERFAGPREQGSSAYGSGLTTNTNVNLLGVKSGEPKETSVNRIWNKYISDRLSDPNLLSYKSEIEKGGKTFKESDLIEWSKKNNVPYLTKANISDMVGGGKNDILIITRTDVAPNKTFKFVSKEGGIEQESQPIGLVKRPTGLYIVGLSEVGKGQYIRKEFPVESNLGNDYFGEYGIEDPYKTFEGGMKLKASTQTVKYENGGIVGKKVFKKFYDRQNGRTKLIYDDNSEEIFEGLI